MTFCISLSALRENRYSFQDESFISDYRISVFFLRNGNIQLLSSFFLILFIFVYGKFFFNIFFVFFNYFDEVILQKII